MTPALTATWVVTVTRVQTATFEVEAETREEALESAHGCAADDEIPYETEDIDIDVHTPPLSPTT